MRVVLPSVRSFCPKAFAALRVLVSFAPSILSEQSITNTTSDVVSKFLP